MDGIESRGACSMVDAIFLPVENKLAQKPAKSVCCCKWELRKGVLIIGGFTTVVAVLEAIVILLVLPVLGAVVALNAAVLGYGLWSVYSRELSGSTPPFPLQRWLDSFSTRATSRDATHVTTRLPHTHHRRARSPLQHALLDVWRALHRGDHYYHPALGRWYLHGSAGAS